MPLRGLHEYRENLLPKVNLEESPLPDHLSKPSLFNVFRAACLTLQRCNNTPKLYLVTQNKQTHISTSRSLSATSDLILYAVSGKIPMKVTRKVWDRWKEVV